MTTDTEAAEPVTAFDPAATSCPVCGSHVLFTVELDYGATAGYRPDHFNVQPVTGDTITRCDDCASFFVHVDDDRPTTPADATPAATGDTSTPDALAALEQVNAGLEQRLAALQAQLQQASAAAPPDTTPPSTSDTSTGPASDTTPPATSDPSPSSASDTTSTWAGAAPPATPSETPNP